MGYYTSYTIQATGLENNLPISEERADAMKERLEAISGYTFEGDIRENLYTSESIKWYDCCRDMNQMSKEFPDLLFIVYGDGEETEDLWYCYHANGMFQFDEAEIRFAGFNQSKLEIYKERERLWF